MPSEFSSVMTIAGAGLFPAPPSDIGATITINTDLTAAIQAYQSLTVISQFQDIVANASAAYDTALLALGATDFAALTDHLPAGTVLSDIYPVRAWDEASSYVVGNQVSYLGDIYQATADTSNQLPTDIAYWTVLATDDTRFTDVIDLSAQRVFGNGDLSKFCQIFLATVAYRDQTNQLLDSIGSSEIYAQTFDPATGGMDTITTGALNQVSSDINLLGADLARMGRAINLDTLDDLGLPGELVAQVGRVAGGELPVLAQAMEAAGIATNQILLLGDGVNQLTSREEKILYQVLQTITGDTLFQVLQVLDVRTEGITNLAQLLDPTLYLPRSFPTLTCPTPQGLIPVYVPQEPSGYAVNGNLRGFLINPLVEAYTGPNNTNGLSELSRIIPADQALATKALVRGLQQIKNIAVTTLPVLSDTMQAVSNIQDLALVGALSTPVPASVLAVYQNNLGQGTGTGGDIRLTDIIGIVTGQDFTSNIQDMTQQLEMLQDSGALVDLIGSQGVYTVMQATQAGTYTQIVMGLYRVVIPGGLPGAGTYGDFATEQLAIDDAFINGLIPAAGTIIGNIAAANAGAVGVTDQAQQSMAQEMQKQTSNLLTSLININELESNSTTAIMAFTGNLHGYGVDIGPGGANEVLLALANLAALSGQALVASLREGRNIVALQTAGIETDTQLPG